MVCQIEHWECVYSARSGGRARALFPTKERAMQFAEQHAHAVVSSGVPLKWEDAGLSAVVLPTQLGDYHIAPTGGGPPA